MPATRAALDRGEAPEPVLIQSLCSSRACAHPEPVLIRCSSAAHPLLIHCSARIWMSFQRAAARRTHSQEDLASPAKAAAMLGAAGVKRSLLFILDLNGTLLHRLLKDSTREAARRHPRARQSCCAVNGNAIHFRPGHAHLLGSLLAHGNVAVWTSAAAKNAVPMVMHTFKGSLDIRSLATMPPPIPMYYANHQAILASSRLERPPCQAAGASESEGGLAFIWCKDRCDVKETGLAIDHILQPATGHSLQSPTDPPPTPKPSKGHYDSPKAEIKNLAKVWLEFPRFSPRTTIMIDDSREKLHAHLDNLIAVPEFLVTDPAVDFTADRALYRLAAYIEQMCTHFAALDGTPEAINVQAYLQSHPPVLDAPDTDPCPAATHLDGTSPLALIHP